MGLNLYRPLNRLSLAQLRKEFDEVGELVDRQNTQPGHVVGAELQQLRELREVELAAEIDRRVAELDATRALGQRRRQRKEGGLG